MSEGTEELRLERLQLAGHDRSAAFRPPLRH
jgi:hypothetical protein